MRYLRQYNGQSRTKLIRDDGFGSRGYSSRPGGIEGNTEASAADEDITVREYAVSLTAITVKHGFFQVQTEQGGVLFASISIN